MKKANKYNLLSKDEPIKEKQQQDWIELQSTANWKNKKSENHDTSYIKLDDQISEIQGDTLHLNSPNHNSTSLPYSSQKPQQYPSSLQNPSKSQIHNTQNQKNQPQQQRERVATSTFQQRNQVSAQDQRNRQANQIPYQAPMNSYNSQFVGPAYVQRSLIPTNIMTNHLIPSFGPRVANYSMINVPVVYPPYQQQSYMNQTTYQSQFQPNMYQQPMPNQSQNQNNPMNSRLSQSSMSQPPANTSTMRSTMSQMNRSSYRNSIPEMTVNCGKCTFTQSVPGNAQMFICCMCNQIDECFPLYGVFTCGICKAKVIYPHGTSALIKCTKCQTINRVNPEPKKKDDEDVVMGKENMQQQEPILGNEGQTESWTEEKMKRDEPQNDYSQQRLAPQSMKKQEQPFKVVPAKKIEPQEKQASESLYPEIEAPKGSLRYVSQKNRQFNEELIELSSKGNETGNENLHKEVLELSQKLDESLILAKEEEKPGAKMAIPHPNQGSSPLKPGAMVETFPSIFDD